MEEIELAEIKKRTAEADAKLARLMRLREVLKEFDNQDSAAGAVDQVLIRFDPSERSMVAIKRHGQTEDARFGAVTCLASEEGLIEDVRAAFRSIIEGRIDRAKQEFEAV